MTRLWWLAAALLVGCLDAPDVQLTGAQAQPEAGAASAADVGGSLDVGLPDRGPTGKDASLVEDPDAAGLDGGARDGAGAAPDGEPPCAPERCDNLDNDCDGQADEGLGLGEACRAGLGECERAGVRVCGADGAVMCSALPGPAGVEACNARDDDCDGTVDEGIAALGCDLVGCGVPGVTRCEAGAVLCGLPEGLAEACEQPGDDDCDGAVDEGCECGAGDVRPCGIDVGACVLGTQRCANGGWGPCEGASVPEAERCDGADNDCDGASDEALGEQPCAADAVGACEVGSTACLDGVLRCLPGAAGAETCDGADQDCDGQADEGFNLGGPCAVGVGGCRRNGQWVCDGAGGVACSAQPGAPRIETCNRGDDDCDGAVDEDFGVGAPCVVGDGLCGSAGHLVCDGPAATVCDAPPPGAGANEVCDGEDNDCDGTVDEAIAARPCAVGVGACQRSGVSTCEAGGVGCSATPGLPLDEVCDGGDNDCDGRVDEGRLGGCDTGLLGACAEGRATCVGGVIGCEPLAPAQAFEACNLVDDDCDGAVDEAVPESGCVTGQLGVCAAGRQVCTAGDSTCVPLVAAGPERCNGVDDDCDGLVDEGPDGALCVRGPIHTSGACLGGRCVFTCVPGFVDADGAPGCERGCTFGEVAPVPSPVIPVRDVAVAVDAEGTIGMVLSDGDASAFLSWEGAFVDLPGRGRRLPALASVAPGVWIVTSAVSGLLNGGVAGLAIYEVRSGVELPPVPSFVAAAGEIFRPLMAVHGPSAEALIIAPRQEAALNNHVRLNVGEGRVGLVELFGLRDWAANATAIAPVREGGWMFGYNLRSQELRAGRVTPDAVSDARGSGFPVEGWVGRGAAVSYEGGVILAWLDGAGRVQLSRFDLEREAFSAPRVPDVPPLTAVSLQGNADTGLWLLGRLAEARGRCVMWPLSEGLSAGPAVDPPLADCAVAAVTQRGAELVILSADEPGQASLLRATCE